MRLTVLAHAETARMRENLFGDAGPLRRSDGAQAWPSAAECFRGPEPACAQTAERLRLGLGQVLPGLAGPDFGSWAGRPLAEVMQENPAGVTSWLSDPDVAPHDGESLAAMAGRVGETLDSHEWPNIPGVIVASPFVARAALVHALGASASAMLRMDVAPLGSVTISRHAGRWRLVSLLRPDRGPS